MSELKPRRARTNAFDLARTDRDDVEVALPVTPLSDLLPRIADQHTGPQAKALTVQHNDPSKEPPSGHRSSGLSPVTTTSTAARVPIYLYDSAEDLVKGRGKPSWGQLIAWTCATRQHDVIREVLTQAQPAPGLIPRGQNKRGTASTQITARFTPAELATFARPRELAQAAADAAEHPVEGPVTATLVVIAALKVATPT